MNNSLQTFSGQPFENVKEWIYTTNRMLEISPYSDKEKTLVASNYLKDLALQEYMLHEQAKGHMTWDNFKKFMKDRFTPKNQSEIIRNKMSTLKQLGNLKEYYIEYRKLANQLEDMSETDKIKGFVDGLKPSTSAWVRFSQKKSLEEAYEAAESFEAFGMQTSQLGNFFSATSNNNTEEENQHRNYSRCTYCQRLGHTESICRTKTREERIKQYQQQIPTSFQQTLRQNESQQPTQLRTPRPNSIICCICQKTGHLGENCWYARQCKICKSDDHLETSCPTKNSSCVSINHKKTRKIEIITCPIKLDGRQAKAALDSAAHVSIISQSLAKQLELEFNNADDTIETSTGEKFKVEGITNEIEVELDNTKAKIKFLITNITIFDILLGLDWFDQTGVLLDPKNGKYIIPQQNSTTESQKTKDCETDITKQPEITSNNIDTVVTDEIGISTNDNTSISTQDIDISNIQPTTKATQNDSSKLNALTVKTKAAIDITNEQTHFSKTLSDAHKYLIRDEKPTQKTDHYLNHSRKPIILREIGETINQTRFSSTKQLKPILDINNNYNKCYLTISANQHKITRTKTGIGTRKGTAHFHNSRGREFSKRGGICDGPAGITPTIFCSHLT